MVDSPYWDICTWASEAAWHVLCDCMALAVLRFRHLGHYCLKPHEVADISVSNVQLLSAWAKGFKKERKQSRRKDHCGACLHVITVSYCVLMRDAVCWDTVPRVFDCSLDGLQFNVLQVAEWKTNLMSLASLFHFLCAQHFSDINISIIRSLQLCCWITTSVVLFSVRCVLEIGVAGFGWCSFCRQSTSQDTHTWRRYNLVKGRRM